MSYGGTGTGGVTLAGLVDTKNMIKVDKMMEYAKDEMKNLRAYAMDGPATFSALGFLGGVLMVATGVVGLLSSPSLVHSVLEAYCIVFGAVAVGLESKKTICKPAMREKIYEYAKFLMYLNGRGAFYVFLGTLELAQWVTWCVCPPRLPAVRCQSSRPRTPSLLPRYDPLVGLYMIAVGAVYIMFGRQTLAKLGNMKESLGSDEVIRKKFNEFDKDRSGTLDSTELAALARSLKNPLDHNELEAAIFMLDADKDGAISFDEFKDWWTSRDERLLV